MTTFNLGSLFANMFGRYIRHHHDTSVNLQGINTLFVKSNEIHSYQTRLATKKSYYLRKVRISYAIFSSNICFKGQKLWNFIEKTLKSVRLKQFKIKIKEILMRKYWHLYRSQNTICFCLSISSYFCCRWPLLSILLFFKM